MKVVGLTGGIGSGKTTVAGFFNELGVPVYIADTEAKSLMNRSKVIKRKLIALFGEKAYLDDCLNKPYIASKIFTDKTLLEQMNAIVHPKVASHFKRWRNKQNAPYVLNESALLFENDSYKKYDLIITVTAPKLDRIKRVLQRDNASEENIRAIMNNQWDDVQRIELSDFTITNNTLSDTKKQVKIIHQKILAMTQ